MGACWACVSSNDEEEVCAARPPVDNTVTVDAPPNSLRGLCPHCSFGLVRSGERAWPPLILGSVLDQVYWESARGRRVKRSPREAPFDNGDCLCHSGAEDQRSTLDVLPITPPGDLSGHVDSVSSSFDAANFLINLSEMLQDPAKSLSPSRAAELRKLPTRLLRSAPVQQAFADRVESALASAVRCSASAFTAPAQDRGESNFIFHVLE